MIKILKEHRDAIMPTKANNEDAGLDIYSIESTRLKPGERGVVEIGLRIVVPQGYYYTFAPRSGLAFKNNVIPSHHNVMDAGYLGPCGVIMLNRGSEEYWIDKGDRFCQLILHAVPLLPIVEVTAEEFYATETSRKEGRLGSSGK